MGFAAVVLVISLLMTRWGGTFASVCTSAALFISLLLSSLVYQVQTTALSPRFFASELDQSRGLEELASSYRDPAIAKALAATIAEQRSAVMAEVRRMLDFVFAYATGKSDALVFTMDVQPVAENFLKHLAVSMSRRPPVLSSTGV